MTAVEPALLGPGLMVRSALDTDGCLRALGQTLLGFGVPEYTHLPSFTPVSWSWDAEPDLPPDTVVICADRTGDDVVVALWPGRGGSRIGLFPLGGDEGRLDSSILAAWRRCDTSLSPAPDRSGAGLISLAPPVLPPGYAEEMVSAAGYRRTRRNTQIVLRTAGGLFLAQAQQFIEPWEPRAARRFLRRHPLRQLMNPAALQEIIDDLARWSAQLLPGLQWMPIRTRAIMLERCQDQGTFWGDLDR